RSRVPIGVKRCYVGRHDVVEVAEPLEIHVQYTHVRAQPGGNLRSVRADHASTENGNLGRRDSRNSGQENSPAFLRTLEEPGSLLDAHPARDLAHRCQERQTSTWITERLVRDRRDPTVDDRTREAL